MDGERAITYGALSVAATCLSERLRAQTTEAELIGVSTTRGLAMVTSVLAILQAGKTYVPLDPSYPAARLQQVISSAKLRHCLAPAEDAALFERLGLQVLASDNEEAESPAEPLAVANELENQAAAYVLYTSGSTGTPKGVTMGQAALVNLLHWQQANSTAGPGTRTLQFAPLSFDVSFQEIFATLVTGGTLVLTTDAERRDLGALLDFIDSARINRLFLPFVALQHLAEIAVSRQQFPASLAEVMTAGEQLKITPQLAAFFTALPACTLYNQYGPTECHVVTQLVLRGAPADWERLPTIGQPIANTGVHVLTPDLRPVPAGEIGELCISGVCLADGYLNQPELTAEKFIMWAPPAGPALRLYRTGDLARLRPNGDLEFLGRQDEQVKVRGHRIELGEVEALLATLPGVGQVAVAVREIAEGHSDLVAYVVPTGATPPEAAALREAAAQVLPAYMLPAAFVTLAEFPKTSSGKINRQALPALATQRRAELGLPYQAPRTDTERCLAKVWARLLRLDKVGVTDNFFELGGTSLLAQTAVAQLQAEFGIRLPVTQLYQHPTVAGAAAYLNQQPALAANEPDTAEPGESLAHDVAIIGMAGRFPGAQTLTELWDLLREGRETTRFFTPEELDVSIAPALRDDPRYVAARGIIAHADEFDAAFFKLNPKLAAAMDPQQRVFLEIAWEALEQAGCLPAHYAGRVGVFAGAGNNSYYPHNVQGNTEALGQLGEFQVMTVNEKDYLASRVAYTLDLKGPAVSVQSACSTGLLAVAQAVQSLRAGQCEVALAGAASVSSPLNSGYLYQEGSMLSADGHCRPFDAQARGTVFSDGAGVVLLKPLAAARRDGDRVYAVIKGVGVNNDGGGKGSFSAPSANGQAAAIAAALADGRVAPASISYVEAHGTATPIGDPIEVEGLRLAFGTVAPNSCALGSIKSNMGHLTAAAGVAGLIKTVLALQHQQLPPTLHYAQANPLLDLANGPFFVNADLR
ncbi:MAG TPA: amino acid adenylation domain-containing protein, partial [Hymenobacter sp.]